MDEMSEDYGHGYRGGTLPKEPSEGPFLVVQYAPWDGSVESISAEFLDLESAMNYRDKMKVEYPHCKYRLFKAL